MKSSCFLEELSCCRIWGLCHKTAFPTSQAACLLCWQLSPGAWVSGKSKGLLCQTWSCLELKFSWAMPGRSLWLESWCRIGISVWLTAGSPVRARKPHHRCHEVTVRLLPWMMDTAPPTTSVLPFFPFWSLPCWLLAIGRSCWQAGGLMWPQDQALTSLAAKSDQCRGWAWALAQTEPPYREQRKQWHCVCYRSAPGSWDHRAMNTAFIFYLPISSCSAACLCQKLDLVA